MREKNIEKIYTYFEILKNINLSFRKLIKYNLKIEEKEDLFYIISGEILRLFPFKIKYDENNNFLYELENDGIMLLKEEIKDLNDIYKNILEKHYTILFQIKTIRNKYEHEPHNIKCVCFMNGKIYTEAIFKYKEKNLTLNTLDLYEFIFDINNEFKKIKNEIQTITKENKLRNYKYNFIGKKI